MLRCLSPRKKSSISSQSLPPTIEIPVLWDKVYETKLSERNIVSSPITRTYEVKFTLDKTQIFLTSMTTAVGVVPMILSGSSLWEPMGVVIFIGTLVSLVFIVTILLIMYWKLCKHPKKAYALK